MPDILSEWLEHFEHLHPVGIDMSLSRVSQVWDKLCQKQNLTQLAKNKIITVAGTNGKGSACQMLSLILSAQGYRVGMYTSPHIHHFRERVKINGAEVDDERLIRAFETIEHTRGDISLSYFEATTLVGLLTFAWENVDYAVLEVGLGGRLDAINIIDADAVLLTSIGLDHEAYLGCNLSQIALEKAGVCRPNKPCIYAEDCIFDSVVEFAEKNRIPISANGRDYTLDDTNLKWHDIILTMPDSISRLGKHQIANCAGVLVLLATLNLLPKDYHETLKNFSLLGRLQLIAKLPDIIVDVAHNEASANALADYMHNQQSHYQKIYAVIGMLRDKDHRAILAAFDGLFAGVFLGRTEGERGFTDTELGTIANNLFTCPVKTCGKLDNALKNARQQAQSNDLIIAFGSFLVAKELT